MQWAGLTRSASSSALTATRRPSERLWRAIKDPLLCCLVRRLGDKESAEEAAQETFARAYLDLRKLKRPGLFSAWLFGIAARVAKEQRGAGGRNRKLGNSLVLKCFPVRLTAVRKSGA